MRTRWAHRLIISVAAEDQGEANALWTLVGPEGDGELGTFGVPLSASGLEPATHYGTDTAATEVMAGLIEAFDPSRTWYEIADDGGVLLASNSPTAEVGDAFGWDNALEDLGLHPIVGEDE